jgi:tetratricopeptide (TPR) repeat protein
MPHSMGCRINLQGGHRSGGDHNHAINHSSTEGGNIMRQLIILTAIVMFFTMALPAQPDLHEFVTSAKETVERGSLVFDKDLLMQGHSMFERALAIEPDNLLLQYHVAYAEYRLMTYLFNREKDRFDPVADKAVERLDRILRRKTNWSEAQALLSAIHGLQIAKSWTRALTLGPKANSLAQQATENDPDNPRAWLMHAAQKLNTPRMFGGSIDEAFDAYKKAVELFENRGEYDPLEPSWGYTDALVWLGITYERLDRDEDALAVFQKVLDVEPEYGWVKYNLLPSLEEKIASNQ